MANGLPAADNTSRFRSVFKFPVRQAEHAACYDYIEPLSALTRYDANFARRGRKVISNRI